MEAKLKRQGPTQEQLKKQFHYDAETGIFTRRMPTKHTRKSKFGHQGAGRISELGYVLIMVEGYNYIAGTLAWLHENGEWPARIKYLNGNKLDNRIANIGVHDRTRDEIKDEPMTQARLKELLHYEPETGCFTWRIFSTLVRPGDRAGGGHGLGYRAIGLDYKKYLEHTLAYLYMTGEWPENEIDHLNRDKSDNRWANLRHVTRSENGRNKSMNKRNKLGFPGVLLHGTKYRSRIDVSGKTLDLGWFVTLAQARIARLLAEKQHFGRFTTWDDERDGQLPMGDGFLAVIMRDNRLYVLSSDGQPIEVTDVKDIQVVPVNDEGAVIQ